MTADEILSLTVKELLTEDPAWIFLLTRVSIEDRGHLTPCWVWTGGTNNQGYATLGTRRQRIGRVSSAHRLAYFMWKEIVPIEIQIHHLCEVRHCINPDHLEGVTRQEHDIYTNRQKLRGELHGSAYLSDLQISRILYLVEEGYRESEVALLIGCSRAYVSNLKAKRKRGDTTSALWRSTLPVGHKEDIGLLRRLEAPEGFIRRI